MSRVSVEDRIIGLVSECSVEEAERRVNLARAILKQRIKAIQGVPELTSPYKPVRKAKEKPPDRWTDSSTGVSTVEGK